MFAKRVQVLDSYRKSPPRATLPPLLPRFATQRRAAQNARKSPVLRLCPALLITRRNAAAIPTKAPANPAKAPFFRLLPARFGPYLHPPRQQNAAATP